MPLAFAENDPDRPAREAQLRAMPLDDLLALYKTTRAAASKAREAHDMEALYLYVRGMKTIQRIASERGLVIRARRPLPEKT
jgi:hypothetical protein